MPRRPDAAPTPSPGSLRALVGAGPSQVGIEGALRARDVSRPTGGDVEAALRQPEPAGRRAEPAARPQRPQMPSGSGTDGATPVSS